MKAILFEDDLWPNLSPLSLTRHVGLMIIGGFRTIDLLKQTTGIEEEEAWELWGRNILARASIEETGLRHNQRVTDGQTLLVNARLNPLSSLKRFVRGKREFVLYSGGRIALARVSRSRSEDIEPGVLSERDSVRLGRGGEERLEAPPGMLFEHPWQMIQGNAQVVRQLPGPEKVDRRGLAHKGPSSQLKISAKAEIEEMVFFDTRDGPVIVDEEASIEAFSRLTGPCYVGRRSRVHSGLIREGTSVANDCRVAGEVEESIMYPFSNKSHYGFLGHSIVGSWVNLGAGSVTSDLKNTYGVIKVHSRGAAIDTGMTKLGMFVGDMAKISIGALVFAGKSLGVGAQVMGLVDKDIPSFTFFDGFRGRRIELKLEPALRTQRRVMERRERKLTQSFQNVLEDVFRSTKQERQQFGAQEGELAA